MPYKGMFPYVPGLEKELKLSRVIEIVDEVWFLEGYISTDFFRKPPSSNCFILRDKDMVLLVDSGTYPFYRETILKVLAKLKRQGAKKLVLMLTQGHFDHVCNNDVILEAGYDEAKFLLPEAELYTIDLHRHWNEEFIELLDYYNPYLALPPVFPTAPVHYCAKISTKLAQQLLRTATTMLFRGINTIASGAEILSSQSAVEKKFGDVTLKGWEIGRFFVIHDATHSPGHCSFYDPKYNLLLSGDATLEINPPFFNGSMNNCIEMMGRFRRLAELGYIEIATDSHRSTIWSARLAEELRYEPLHRTQTLDVIYGKQDCIAFYSFFERYYLALKNTVLESLKRLGSATVPQLVKEFKASSDPHARLKTAAVFPRLPSRIDVLVANVLKEACAPRRKEKGEILFSLPT